LKQLLAAEPLQQAQRLSGVPLRFSLVMAVRESPFPINNAGAQAMQFDFNEEKNQLLLRERGVTFQAVIKAILDQGRAGRLSSSQC